MFVPPSADMEKLEVLDLEGNRVDDPGALVYLGWCPQLAVLTLADNPVAQEPAYNAQVVTLCILWFLGVSLRMLYSSAYRTRPVLPWACCLLTALGVSRYSDRTCNHLHVFKRSV